MQQLKLQAISRLKQQHLIILHQSMKSKQKIGYGKENLCILMLKHLMENGRSGIKIYKKM